MTIDSGVDRHANAVVAADILDRSCECDGEFAVSGHVAVPTFVSGVTRPGRFGDDGADARRCDYCQFAVGLTAVCEDNIPVTDMVVDVFAGCAHVDIKIGWVARTLE